MVEKTGRATKMKSNLCPFTMFVLSWGVRKANFLGLFLCGSSISDGRIELKRRAKSLCFICVYWEVGLVNYAGLGTTQPVPEINILR